MFRKLYLDIYCRVSTFEDPRFTDVDLSIFLCSCDRAS